MFPRLERKDEYPENVAIAIAKTESNTIAQVRNPHYRSVSMGHGYIEVVYGSGPPIPTFCAHSIRICFTSFLQKLNLPENNIKCMKDSIMSAHPQQCVGVLLSQPLLLPTSTAFAHSQLGFCRTRSSSGISFSTCSRSFLMAKATTAARITFFHPL